MGKGDELRSFRYINKTIVRRFSFKPPFFMKSIFPKERHTFLILAYFVLQIISLFIHHRYIYLGYEILFVLTLYFSMRYLSNAHQYKSLLFQSLLIHLSLTLLYLVVLINTMSANFFESPLSWIVFYPALHFILSFGLFNLKLHLYNKRNKLQQK